MRARAARYNPKLLLSSYPYNAETAAARNENIFRAPARDFASLTREKNRRNKNSPIRKQRQLAAMKNFSLLVYLFKENSIETNVMKNAEEKQKQKKAARP